MSAEIQWLRAEVAALHGQEAPDVGVREGWEWERGANGPDGLPTWQLNDPDGCAVTRIVIGAALSWEGWAHTDRVQARSLTEAMRAGAVYHDAVWTGEEIRAEIARLESIRELNCNYHTCGEPCERCVLLTEDEVDAMWNANLTQVLDAKMARMHELLAAPWVRPPAGPATNQRS